MASERRTLKTEKGVSLVEISLRANGNVVDRAYLVKTLRSPETWSFANEVEANARFDDEVQASRKDPFVQGRLS